MAFRSFFSGFFLLQPLFRRFLLIFIDIFLLSFSIWLTFWLRLAHPFHSSFISSGSWMLLGVLLIGLPLYAITGQYKGLTRYVGSTALYRLSLRNGLLVLLLAFLGLLFRLPMPPRSSWLLLWLLITSLTGSVRFCMRDVLITYRSSLHVKQLRVAIYGAGEAGTQLAASLRLAGNHQIISFLDDDPNLWQRNINGIPIEPPQKLSSLNGRIDQVLLAIPSLPRSRRRSLVAQLQTQSLPVLQIPSVDDLISGKAHIDSLRPVLIEDLLGRDSVPPDPVLLGSGIRGSVVCVTGAGGSIGSELCRQILKLSPSRLILLERSEPALYSVEEHLRLVLPDNTYLQSVLGCAADEGLLNALFSSVSVDVVFHAAAYKHVPLVEANPLSGLYNNVFSTRALCRSAFTHSVGDVVLISTDKAVRPTNVMGASKRLAELVVQASFIDATNNALVSPQSSPRFSMVRFGNVLGSSGSVVPLFRRQIASGGPITLTHPEIIRYFMTIAEAAELVLQAFSLSKGGDLFLLDMGDPVRIKDLAEQMVKLSGLSLLDLHNPAGDIEIICTGLRPGEKLYEELLIDAESEPTKHPLIYRAIERSLPPGQLWPSLDLLENFIRSGNVESSLNILSELVPEWQRSQPHL